VRLEGTKLGVTLIVASVFVLSFGDAMVKFASADLSLWQIYVARGVFAVPILIGLLTLSGGRPIDVMPKSLGWVLVRSMLLVLMWITYYAALPVMNLSVAAVALYTTPLFIALFSAFLIGEPVGLRRWAGIIIGFIGVLVILRPDTDAFSIPTLLPVVAAVFYALAAVITRSKLAGERPLVLSLGLNLCLLGIGIVAIGALAVWNPSAEQASAYPFLLDRWIPMGAREWGLVAFLAAVIVAVSTGVAKAYQSGPAAIIGTFDYSYLAFAVLWSFVIFSQPPDVATIIGVILIAMAGWLVIGGTTTPARTAEPPLRAGNSVSVSTDPSS
jgi:drug/metabolite transporter (DMT)-like permease